MFDTHPPASPGKSQTQSRSSASFRRAGDPQNRTRFSPGEAQKDHLPPHSSLWAEGSRASGGGRRGQHWTLCCPAA